MCIVAALVIAVIPSKAESTAVSDAYVSTLSFCQSKEQFARHAAGSSTKPRPISLANVPQTDEEKALLIYGDAKYADYTLRKAAELAQDKSIMISVEVPIWTLSNGTKVPSTVSMVIRPELEELVKAVFDEIFAGPEKFPIVYAACFRPVDSIKTSEHLVGQAIDINPRWNPELVKRNGVLVSSDPAGWPKWDLTSPYGISPDGDVVTAFKRYGFKWGGDWIKKKDYMHFSYFGG